MSYGHNKLVSERFFSRQIDSTFALNSKLKTGMADFVQRFAQEIVNSDYFWSRLDAEGKFKMLRRSMGLPINPKSGQFQWCDGLEEKESRTIFVKIHQVEYLISWEVLNKVFSTIGDIEVIEIFDKDFHYHSRIRFKNGESVIKAFDSLNGRCIYDDCCRMELFVVGRVSSGLIENESSVEDVTNRRVHQPEATIEDASQVEKIKEPDSSREFCEMESKDSSSETKKLDSDLVTMGESFQEMGDIDGQLSPDSKQIMAASESFYDSSEVISDSFESVISTITFEGSMKFVLGDLKLNTVEYVETSENAIAHKVFPEMSRFGEFKMEPNVIRHEVKFPLVVDMLVDKQKWWDGNLVFDPGISDMSSSKWSSSAYIWFLSGDLSGHEFRVGMSAFTDSNKLVYGFLDEEKMVNVVVKESLKLMPSCGYDSLIVDLRVGNDISIFDLGIENYDQTSKFDRSIFIFDPGGVFSLFVAGLALEFRGYNPVMEVEIKDQRLQWDPGGLMICLIGDWLLLYIFIARRYWVLCCTLKALI